MGWLGARRRRAMSPLVPQSVPGADHAAGRGNGLFESLSAAIGCMSGSRHASAMEVAVTSLPELARRPPINALQRNRALSRIQTPFRVLAQVRRPLRSRQPLARVLPVGLC